MNKDISPNGYRDQVAVEAMKVFLVGIVIPTEEDQNKYLPIIAAISYKLADFMAEARNKL